MDVSDLNICDFDFPEDFRAPSGADDIGTLHRVDTQMHESKLNLAADELKGAGSPWPEGVKHTMSTLWNQFTVDSVHWLIEYSREALCVAIEADHTSTKKVLIETLVEAQVPPISLASLQNFVAAWKAHASGTSQSPDGMDEGGGHGGSRSPSCDEGDDDDDADVSADGGDISTDGQSGANASGIEEILRSLTTVVKQNSQTLAAFGQRAGTGCSDDKKDSPLERHYAVIDDQLRQGQFVDPMQLSNPVIDKMKFKIPGQTNKSEKIGSLTLTSEAGPTNSAGWFNPEGMKQGFERLVLRVLDIKEIHHRARDMMRFSEKLWNFAGPSDDEKAKFMKHFMFEHAGEENWADSMFLDMQLMSRFLWPKTQSDMGQRFESLKRRRDEEKNAFSRSQRPSRSGAGRQERPTLRARTRTAKVCYTRLDPNRGECTYPSCRFSHQCASCGQNHSASACPKWDDAKGRRAMTDAQRRDHPSR